jgi:hypothetical protein
MLPLGGLHVYVATCLLASYYSVITFLYWLIPRSLPSNRPMSHSFHRGVHIYFFICCFFLQSTQDIKRIISKRDGCVYLKQVPSIDGSPKLI